MTASRVTCEEAARALRAGMFLTSPADPIGEFSPTWAQVQAAPRCPAWCDSAPLRHVKSPDYDGWDAEHRETGRRVRYHELTVGSVGALTGEVSVYIVAEEREGEPPPVPVVEVACVEPAQLDSAGAARLASALLLAADKLDEITASSG